MRNHAEEKAGTEWNQKMRQELRVARKTAGEASLPTRGEEMKRRRWVVQVRSGRSRWGKSWHGGLAKSSPRERTERFRNRNITSRWKRI